VKIIELLLMYVHGGQEIIEYFAYLAIRLSGLSHTKATLAGGCDVTISFNVSIDESGIETSSTRNHKKRHSRLDGCLVLMLMLEGNSRIEKGSVDKTYCDGKRRRQKRW